jgi:hypothetical protein
MRGWGVGGRERERGDLELVDGDVAHRQVEDEEIRVLRREQ